MVEGLRIFLKLASRLASITLCLEATELFFSLSGVGKRFFHSIS